MTMRAVRVVVTGRVQGVGFRYAALQQAKALGLTGWVRNRSDGSVEAWVEGSAADVDLMLQWLAQGPGFARVRHLQVSEDAVRGLNDFSVAGDE